MFNGNCTPLDFCLSLYNFKSYPSSQNGLVQRWKSIPGRSPGIYLLPLNGFSAVVKLTKLQTVLITGGSQGLGESTARLLAQKGANVIIVARDVNKLQLALSNISVGSPRIPPRENFTQHASMYRPLLFIPQPNASTT